MVLDGVVRSSWQEAGDGSPLVTVDGVSLDDDGILGGSKRTVLYAWAELIAPSEPARLSGPSRNAEADERPIARAVVVDELDESGILLGAPRALDPIGSDVV